MGGFRFGGGDSGGGGGGGVVQGKLLKFADKTATSGTGLTWGDNGDNLTLSVAIASGTGTKPQHFMGYIVWDTGYTVADMPTLQMHMERVSSPTSAVTGPPVMMYGIVIDDAVGNIDFGTGGSSTARWGGLRWANGSNGENNQLTNNLRANQTPGYSGNLSVKTTSTAHYGFKQTIQYTLRKDLNASGGAAGSYFTEATYTCANYPGSNGNGTYAAFSKDTSESSALTSTDKIFWFIGIFRHGNVGSGAVSLEFKMTATALKGIGA